MKEEITSDALVEAKLETVDMIHQLGVSAYGISEAIRDFEDGRNLLCEGSCEIAVNALFNLEKQVAATRAKIDQWKALFAKEGGEE